MSDLISRSELKEDLGKWCGIKKNVLEAVIWTVDKQEVAYDVDKVVVMLEKEFKKHYGSDWSKIPCLAKAIEIVQTGEDW